MVLPVLFCLLGFLLLCLGADWLVKGSVSLARKMGVSPLLIGLTVVAFGTSAPEFVVSLVSSIQGSEMIAVGNVIGSNICNIALVLGLSLILRPACGDRAVVRRDIPIMLGISVGVLLIAKDGRITTLDGALLAAGIVAYTVFNYVIARRGRVEERQRAEAVEGVPTIDSPFVQAFLIVVGIAGVVGGAKLVVDSAIEVMRQLDLSEKFIGLTMVALGTSLPELATSVVAALRKEMDISVGNLVGSNVFNLLGVLGAAALVRPIRIPGGLVESGMYIDYLVMLGTSAFTMLLLIRSAAVARGVGVVLFATYVGYIAYLVAKG